VVGGLLRKLDDQVSVIESKLLDFSSAKPRSAGQSVGKLTDYLSVLIEKSVLGFSRHLRIR
jgi:hypothetical protein